MGLLLGLVKLYFGIGFVLGLVLLGSIVVHAAMVVPPIGELVGAAGEGALQGAVRMVMWAPSLYRRVIQGEETILTWLLY